MNEAEQGYARPYAEDSTEETPEIQRAEMRLAEAVSSVNILVGRLESRLDRVLRAEDSEPTADPVKAMLEVRTATTQLTDFLDAQASRLESESVRLTDILRRLGL